MTIVSPPPNPPLGDKVHYFSDSGDPCHASLIIGNFIIDDTEGIPLACDLLQMDAVGALGLTVPLRRNTIAFDETCTEGGTVHYSCPR
jgi:hypothetical protein